MPIAEAVAFHAQESRVASPMLSLALAFLFIGTLVSPGGQRLSPVATTAEQLRQKLTDVSATHSMHKTVRFKENTYHFIAYS